MAKKEDLLVVLLDFWISPFCQRVKIALAEKGIAYEIREEKNPIGAKSDLLLKSNPIYQKVPVLFYKGKPIIESTNIVYFIEDNWPSSPPLMPSCAYQRSQARFWVDFIDKRVFEDGGKIWKSKGSEAEDAKKNLIDTLKKLEGGLEERDYFGGDKFGLVDIIIIPMTPWFLAYEKYCGFKVEEEAPKFGEWIKRCMVRETVAKALPDLQKVHEYLAMLRKMHGLD